MAHTPLRTGAGVAVAVVVVIVAGGCASRKDREARRHGTIPLDRSVITGFTPDATASARFRPAWTSPYVAPAAVVTTTPRFSPVDATDSAAGPVIYAGAAPIPAAAPLARPAVAPAIAMGGAGTRYTVARGDTLFGIARARYGSGGQWQRIAAANPGLSPETLKAGTTIVVP